MKILVTGGCGFIGSHLVEALVAQNHQVTVLDDLSTGKREHLPAAATLVVGDVGDAVTVAPLVQAAEAVFHLAAIASVVVCEQEPQRAERTNVQGLAHIMATADGRAVIYASSAAVYGDNPDLPLDEDAVLKPLSHYGRHKQQCELLGQQFAGSVPSVGLRFFNVYGPRQDAASPYSGVISKFMANLRGGRSLTFFGDGEQTRDFIYVGDVVRLLLAAWQQADGTAQLFNGCTGKAVSLKQLAAAIGEAAGQAPEMQYAPGRTGDIRHSLGSPARAAAKLGFNAAVELGDGLRQLWASGA